MPFSSSPAIRVTFAIGIANPTTSLLPVEAAVVMPTTSPSSSYVAPPESPEMTSLLILISPRSFSPACPSSLLVVMFCPVASTSPAAAEKVEVLPPASPTAVTASPTETPSVSGVTVCNPLAFSSWSTATSSLASVPTTVAV